MLFSATPHTLRVGWPFLFRAYRDCLARKKYGIVNTENLSSLDALFIKRGLYFGPPLNNQGGTGSPIRAFAYVPE